MNRRASFAIAILLTALTSVTSTATAFWSSNPFVNTPVATVSGGSIQPTIAPDGTGGAFVSWWDFRIPASYSDIYAQHFDRLGRPQWEPNGRLLFGGINYDGAPQTVADGQGGFFVGFARVTNIADPDNQDLLIQRYDANGNALWTPGGVLISTVVHIMGRVQVVADGANGAIVVWSDDRNDVGGDYDVFAQRLRPNGSIAWTSEGVSLCTATGNQFLFTSIGDGPGGAYVAWQDHRGPAADIYFEHVDSIGTRRYGANGFPLCNAGGFQGDPAMVSDGQGGAVVTWTDLRGADNEIYGQRMRPGGPAWSPNGMPVVSFAGHQSVPAMLGDGDGGAFVTWTDARDPTPQVYGQRLSRNGFPVWTASGVAITTSTLGCQLPQMVSDNAGGFLVVYQDFRDPSQSLFAQRVSLDGVLQWASAGSAVTRAADEQDPFAIISDGGNGLLAVWEDARVSPVDADIYAERIEGFGFAGVPEPVIASALDVPNDQGGKVKVSWYGSWPELPPTNAVDIYHLFRSVPPNLVAERVARGESVVPAAEGCSSPGCVMELSGEFWEFVGSQNAFDLTAYSYLVPTTGDSVGGSNPLTKFMVQARASNAPQYWNSQPDSGYSVDDLAPATPSPFSGIHVEGVTSLQWGANGEADLAGYRLHRGLTPTFTPTPGNLLTSTAETSYQDPGAEPYYYYKLAAIDSHGNLSGYAVVVPAATTDVSETPLPKAIALGRVSPNPSRGGGVSFRIALPAPATVRVSVFDTQGREVRRVVEGVQTAGEHLLKWDGRDDARNLPRPGVYVIRLEVAGKSWVQRFALVR